MKWFGIGAGVVIALVAAMPLVMFAQGCVSNPKVEQELFENPQGERARKVMLLTLPSGRKIPVNFLRENGRVYAGADGWWWKALRDGPHDVKVFVQGESLAGRATAVLDQPDYKKDVFSRLRPSAIPGTGTLVEILLDPADPGGPIR